MLVRSWLTASCLALVAIAAWERDWAAAQVAAPSPVGQAIAGAAGAQPTWGQPDADGRFQIIEQAIVPLNEREAASAELIRLSAGNGSYIYLSRPVAEARVIEELQIELAVKADQPGIELLAHVVLPRSVDPNSGKPVTCLLSGGSYSQPGQWQTLRFDRLPLELERQARLLRSRLGPQIDTREAYIDRVLVNLYTGPGNSTVLLGRLDIAGLIRRDLSADEQDELAGPPRRRADIVIGRPRLDGAVLLIDNRPFLPRAIDYQGEPLPYLQQLGFNTIRFKSLPDESLLDECARLGLWAISPPPFGPPVGSNPSPPPGEQATEEYDPVIAWDLGSGLTNVEIPAIKGWTELIRSWDRDRNRPLLATPVSSLRVYSRHLNIMLLDRTPLGTTAELADYAEWLRQRPRLARPGSPVWTAISTQPPPPVVDQCRMLSGNPLIDVSYSPEQLRLLVYSALNGGARALLLGSHSRLDATDLATRSRAEALELLNYELALVESWLAAGQTALNVTGSEPQARAALVRSEQARVLIPIWLDRGSQYVPGQSAGYKLSFVVPGVPESHEAYELTAAGLVRMKLQREAGGMRLTLDEFDVGTLVALTQDPLIVSSLTRRVEAVPDRVLQLARNLAVAKLMRATDVDRQLNGTFHNMPQAAARLESARKSLAECDRLLAEKKYPAAYREVQRTSRPVRYLERAYWDAAVARLPSPVTSPLAVCFSTLPDHERFLSNVGQSAWAATSVREGEFENLQAMHQAGWRYFEHADPAVRTAAALSTDQPHGGRHSLLLRATAADPKATPSLIETAPLWITSPAAQVAAGQTVRIRGWVRIRQPIAGSIDGLMILDSLTGEALAERINRTEGWKEFVLYRAVPQSGRLAVTFALTGLGEAWIDDVRIEVKAGALPAQPPVAAPGTPPNGPPFGAPGAAPALPAGFQPPTGFGPPTGFAPPAAQFQRPPPAMQQAGS